MTRDQIVSDLYARLTSRKFLSFVLTIAFLIWNFMEGRIDALQFQVLFWASATTYGLVEGAGDFAKSWSTKPETTVRNSTTVNTGTEAPSASTSPTSTPARTVRRSRAKAPAVPSEPMVDVPMYGKVRPAQHPLTEPVVGVPPLRRPRARPPLTDEPEGLT